MPKKNNSHPPAAGGSGEPGRAVDPTQALPEQPESCPGDVPIGLPIPFEHLEALQEDAKRRKPRRPDVSQADPGSPGDP